MSSRTTGPRIRHHGDHCLLRQPAVRWIIPLSSAMAVAAGGRTVALTSTRPTRRPFMTVPVIGLIKRGPDSPCVRHGWKIDALAQGGAVFIAIDRHPASASGVSVGAIRRNPSAGEVRDGRFLDLDDALECWRSGARIVAATLRLYRRERRQMAPDLALVQCLSVGRLSDCRRALAAPAQAAEAMRCGAWAVTVGSAITAASILSGWSDTALKAAVCRRIGDQRADRGGDYGQVRT